MASVQGFQEHRLSRTELRELVRKHWLLVVVVFLSGTVAMWLCLPIFFTDLYESKTTLLVKLGRENVETPETVQRGQVMAQGVQVADINSEVELLQSRWLVEQVVDKLGPDAFKSVLKKPDSIWGYPKYMVKFVARQANAAYQEFLVQVWLKKRLGPREEAVLRVEEGAKVEPIRDSDVLTLKVRTPSPQLSVDVSNALLDAYLRQRAKARKMPAGSAFFNDQMKEAEDRLNQALKQREQVRSQWDLSSTALQQAEYLKQLSDIQSEIVKNNAEVEKLKSQRGMMLSRFGDLPDLVAKEQVDALNPTLQSLRERVTSLRLERAKTASSYLPNSEVIRRLDEEIDDLEKTISAQPKTVVTSRTSEENPSRREFQSGIEDQAVQIAGLETRDKALRNSEQQISGRLHDLSLGTDQLESAEREYKLAEEDYLLYSNRLQEARMSEELDAQRLTNVAIVAPPETPIEPASPNKLFLMEIAMAVSLLLGVALATIVETMDDRLVDERTVSQIDDVAYLGHIEFKKAS